MPVAFEVHSIKSDGDVRITRHADIDAGLKAFSDAASGARVVMVDLIQLAETGWDEDTIIRRYTGKK